MKQGGLWGFHLDSLVAEGLVERVLRETGEPAYKPIMGRVPWQFQ
jgi:hypothetical protein